ncbi:hypothetical protein GMSM_00180 [Geomonas sp. Red276]
MKKGLSEEQVKEIAELAAMTDEEIDYSDIPPGGDWEGAVVGKFYRPIKQAVTIRLDADVVDWLKRGGKGYQTRVNKLLRTAMERQLQQAQKHPRKEG